MASSGKRPLSVAIPMDWKQAKDNIEYYLRRLFRESTNAYSNFFFQASILEYDGIQVGSQGPGSPAEAPMRPYRNRRYLELQMTGVSLAGKQLTGTLYNTQINAANRIFDFTITAPASGYAYGKTSTVIVPGMDYVSSDQSWMLIVSASSGDWTNVTGEVTYEDFVPYV